MGSRSHSVAVAIALVSLASLASLACGEIIAFGEDDASPIGDASSEGAAADALADASCDGLDFAIDPKNCGRCGNDCGVAACSAGKCGPVKIVELGGRIRRLVEQGDSLYAVVLGPPDRIERIAKAAPFAHEDIDPNAAAPDEPKGDVAGHASGVFWGTPNGLRHRPADGGPTVTLENRAPVRGVRVQGDQLAWTVYQPSTLAQNPGAIGTCSLPACKLPTTSESIHYPWDAVVVGDVTYWLGIHSLHPSGFVLHAGLVEKKPIGDVQMDPMPMVANDENIYWSTRGSLSRFHVAAQIVGELFATVTAERVNGIALDGAALYFGRQSAVFRCSLSVDGGSCNAVEQVADGDGIAEDVVIDQNVLYWATSTGALYRIPL